MHNGYKKVICYDTDDLKPSPTTKAMALKDTEQSLSLQRH